MSGPPKSKRPQTPSPKSRANSSHPPLRRPFTRACPSTSTSDSKATIPESGRSSHPGKNKTNAPSSSITATQALPASTSVCVRALPKDCGGQACPKNDSPSISSSNPNHRKSHSPLPPNWKRHATPMTSYALPASPTSETQDPQKAKNHCRVKTGNDQKARPETHAGLRSRGGLHTCSLESPGLNATGGPDTLITVSPCKKTIVMVTRRKPIWTPLHPMYDHPARNVRWGTYSPFTARNKKPVSDIPTPASNRPQQLDYRLSQPWALMIFCNSVRGPKSAGIAFAFTSRLNASFMYLAWSFFDSI